MYWANELAANLQGMNVPTRKLTLVQADFIMWVYNGKRIYSGAKYLLSIYYIIFTYMACMD